MTNETNETIIDSETNNEQAEEIELEIEEDTEVATEEKPVDKPVETPEARLARLRRQIAQQEKKMGIVKETKKEETQTTSTRDLIALMEAKVQADDIEVVEEFAKFRKISIAEALKTNVVKTLIADSQEKRKVAQATNTGTAKKSPSAISDEALLEKARGGDIPESEADMKRIIEAKLGIKKK